MSSGKCPYCGGEVKDGKCLYCDSVVNTFAETNAKVFEAVKEIRLAEAKVKNKKYTVQLFITIAVILVIIVGIIISLINGLSRITKSVSERKVNTNNNVIVQEIKLPDVTVTYPKISRVTTTHTQVTDKTELYKDRGLWPSGVYEIGKDIPEGTYLAVKSGNVSETFPMGLYSDSQARDEDNIINETWSGFSRYITLKEPGFINVSWANMYDIEKSDVINDPHKHSGMFLVGRDIEAGTYQLTFDRYFCEFESEAEYGYYCIYSDVDAINPIMEDRGKFSEGMEITVKDGDFLRLVNCLIKE